MSKPSRPNVADFYEREILPALIARLDKAFPEFAWRRDPRGWHATNQEFTHATLGVRADRVVCHGEAPRGFLVHGQGPVPWTTYVNNGQPARGRDFIDAVRQLSARSGLDADQLDRPPSPAERKADLLLAAFELSHNELASERGAAARAYLERRGIPPDRLADADLGVVPDRDRLRLALLSAGYRDPELATSGLFADSRWPGRVVGAWRDERSRVVTLWTRTLDDSVADDRYLYLRGAPRAGTIPYGLSDLIAPPTPARRSEITLVEGVMDVHVFRAHGMRTVAAVGGAAASSDLFERLTELHFEQAILAFDNDDAGRAATINAIDAATRAHHAPDLWVIDPDLYGSGNDPGEVVRDGGAGAWQRVATAPTCAVTWRALDLTGPIAAPGRQLPRHAGLARAGAWLGGLPPRLAVEQTAALDTVAESLGYDPDAVRRAFRARYWRREATLEPSRAEVVGR